MSPQNDPTKLVNESTGPLNINFKMREFQSAHFLKFGPAVPCRVEIFRFERLYLLAKIEEKQGNKCHVGEPQFANFVQQQQTAELMSKNALY